MPKKLDVVIAEGDLKNKIYIIRGQRVMLDFDLAEIYGYTTKAFNQQVKNNIEKFDEDFRFRLSRSELNSLSRSKILTSIQTPGVRGGRAYLPYAFTEQGIYMLMTVLKGELAIRQSKTLIRLFKSMKDYLLDGQSVVSTIIENSRDISQIKTEIGEIQAEIEETVKKSEISPIFLDFATVAEDKELLFLEGEPVQAKEAFLKIYKRARKKIYIVDNYINMRTLHLLQTAGQNIEVTFFTDNICNYLRRADIEDFKKERPDLKINFIKTCGKIHDRFIILDEKAAYQAGASSKDAGNKMAFIHKISDDFVVKTLLGEMDKLKQNPSLELK